MASAHGMNSFALSFADFSHTRQLERVPLRSLNRKVDFVDFSHVSFADFSHVDFVYFSLARQISSKLDLLSLNRKVRHNEQARSALA